MSTTGRSLRIAQLAFSALPRTVGGLEVVVDSLLRAQLDAGCEVRLVTRWKEYRAAKRACFPYPASTLPPNPQFDPDPIGSVGPRWPVSMAVRLYQWRYRFDVWHIHAIYPAGWMAHDVLVGMSVPVVLTAHGVDVEMDASIDHGYRLRPIHDRRLRELARKAACFTAISSSIADRYAELGVPSERVVRIPNGVDVGRFRQMPVNRAEIRAAIGVPVDATLVLTVGADRPAKGHRFIPPALAALRRQGHNLVWVVLGGNPDRMQERACAEGVDDGIVVIPAIANEVGHTSRFPNDRVVAIYKSADIFALPSVNEGFGMVAIEAMAAGLPIVASEVGGLKDIIEDGVDGLLCSPASPESLATAIGRILNEPGLRSHLAAAAERTVQRYDWTTVSGEYLQVYRNRIAASAQQNASRAAVLADTD